MSTCRMCLGLESLIRRHDVEQVLIRGRNEHGKIGWIVDVITVDADGHRAAGTLDDAMNHAIREVVPDETDSN